MTAKNLGISSPRATRLKAAVKHSEQKAKNKAKGLLLPATEWQYHDLAQTMSNASLDELLQLAARADSQYIWQPPKASFARRAIYKSTAKAYHATRDSAYRGYRAAKRWKGMLR